MGLFAENLKRLRKEKGLNQADVAEHISTSLTQIRRWESGETSPSIDNAALLAQFYKTSLDALYGLEQDKGVLDVSGLSDGQREAIKMIIEEFTP